MDEKLTDTSNSVFLQKRQSSVPINFIAMLPNTKNGYDRIVPNRNLKFNSKFSI